MLGFFKALKKHYLVCWFQCSQEGFDAYAGSKFVFEVQISETNDIGSPSVFRERIPSFLTVNDLAKVTVIENKVKDKLRLPPNTHDIFGMDEDIALVQESLCHHLLTATLFSNTLACLLFIIFRN